MKKKKTSGAGRGGDQGASKKVLPFIKALRECAEWATLKTAYEISFTTSKPDEAEQKRKEST